MSCRIKTQTVPTMYFIGVTTGKSSIMKVFPIWAQELGRQDVHLEGMDLPLHADAGQYRQAVAQIKGDPLSLGALVTSHKINLFEAASGMFDSLDRYAQVCGEVSCISKDGGRLEGHAKDPITSGLSLNGMLGPNYFGRTGAHVLCLGAGGSTVAIALHFIHRRSGDDRPQRIVVVNRSSARLEGLKKVIASQPAVIEFEYHCHTDPVRNDALMAKLPPYSLVINATGMGKDLPGSPITNNGTFPEHGIAWELNYRGELDFLRQALAQREVRTLTVFDGWEYFLHGWTQVIAQILKVGIKGEVFQRLSALAAEVCGPAFPPIRRAIG